MTFEFATANRIIFGPGKASEIGQLAAGLGNRVLLVTGRTPDRVEPVTDSLKAAGVNVTIFPVPGEPTTDLVQSGADQDRTASSDMVIGVGGGSVLDAGKAIAALLTNKGDLFDYLEVIGKAIPIPNAPAPYIAMPTTAGTGAEVTRNAVLESPAHGVKVSMRSPLMLPKIALVDPELTYAMPPEITAATGLDALTQLLEAFVGVGANPLTDAICREGLMCAARGLRRAYENGEDKAARSDMCVAGLFGGLALANAKLGAVHGLAAPLGGMFDVPHGVVCAALLPHVMTANVMALREPATSSEALERHDAAARVLTGRSTAASSDLIRWIEIHTQALAVPRLSKFGITREALPAIAEKAQAASSMKGNPVPLTDEDLINILEKAL